MITRHRGIATAFLMPLSIAGVFVASPAQAATVVVEAERMTVATARVVSVVDYAASGGAAVSMRTNGTLTGSLTPYTGASRLVVRLRGDQYLGAPRVVIKVDGVQVAAFSVAATRWTNYSVTGSWAAGAHTVQVGYTNDLAGADGNRNLLVDRALLESTTTTTPTTPPTTPTTPPPPTAPTPPPTAPSTVNDAYETRIVDLVNAERTKAGLKPLAVSACVDGYAEEWSAHMASTGTFEHRSDLMSPMRACAARGIGENIAYGNVSADAMMTMWMNSSGHRANILNAGYTHIGVGATTTSAGRVYGTQNFLTV